MGSQTQDEEVGEAHFFVAHLFSVDVRAAWCGVVGAFEPVLEATVERGVAAGPEEEGPGFRQGVMGDALLCAWCGTAFPIKRAMAVWSASAPAAVLSCHGRITLRF